MQQEDLCFLVDGVRFWTDARGTVHVVKTPDSEVPLDPPFVLKMPNPPDFDGISIGRDYATGLIRTGAMRTLVREWCSGQK